MPLGLVIEEANRHDMKVLSATLDSQVVERPELGCGITHPLRQRWMSRS
jgi:hypothetical protein